MTIRTEAVKMYLDALDYIRYAYSNNIMDGFRQYDVDNVGNKGYGIEINGIKYCLAKIGENGWSGGYFSNSKRKSIVIPISPELLDATMDTPFLQFFLNYFDMAGEIIIHELVHLLYSREKDYSKVEYDDSSEEVYYNNEHERLAYAAEIYSVLERDCGYKDKVIASKLMNVNNRVKFSKIIKDMFKGKFSSNAITSYFTYLTDDNYEWFAKYVKSEYKAARRYYE